MTITKFEDIIAWQKAQDLAVTIHKEFSKSKEFAFKDQIFRSILSVSNNIAEGFDHSSDAEFIRFLYYARSSCSETRSMLYLAERLNFLSKEKVQKLLKDSSEVSRVITGFIKSI